MLSNFVEEHDVGLPRYRYKCGRIVGTRDFDLNLNYSVKCQPVMTDEFVFRTSLFNLFWIAKNIILFIKFSAHSLWFLFIPRNFQSA